MSSEETRGPLRPGDITHVDLGDDLLERTATLPGITKRKEAPKKEDVPEELVFNAEVLSREGLIEEAKRLLRRALILDPYFLPAKKNLEALEAQEVEILRTGRDLPKRRDLGRVAGESIRPQDAATILEGLERDLGIDLRQDWNPVELPEEEKLRFESRMREEASRSNLRTRLDLGIFVMELGLLSTARTLLQDLLRAGSEEQDPEAWRKLPKEERAWVEAAFSCLMQAKVEGGLAFEAKIELEPFVREPLNREEDRQSKMEWVYWMGRACAALGNLEEACAWYQEIASVDPSYRDVTERIHRWLENPS